jgi:hypothetical protein
MKQQIKNLYSLLQGKSRKVAWAVVPSVVVILTLLLFMAEGCEKKEDVTQNGTLIILDKPIKTQQYNIYAYFYPDTNDVCDPYSFFCGVINKPPMQYKKGDTVKVFIIYNYCDYLYSTHANALIKTKHIKKITKL